MSWGSVPFNMLVEIAISEGAMFQQELDLGCPIYVFVNPKYLTSVVNGHSVYMSDGTHSGVLGTEDHPHFRDTRNWLEKNEYIQCEHGYWNGDKVLKPFFFNNELLVEGEKFSCAGAMNTKQFTEKYNDGEPDYTLKNYKGIYDDYSFATIDEDWW